MCMCMVFLIWELRYELLCGCILMNIEAGYVRLFFNLVCKERVCLYESKVHSLKIEKA